jgi:CheY-like chemotaxis protein
VGDRTRLEQVLFNLVGNAVKFTDSGQVAVEACPLTASGPSTARVLFSVSDTGRGIPDHLVGKMFQPFSQAESAYSRGYEGAGLGLSIVKRLLDLMGGKIAVDSEVGRGSVVNFCLAFDLPESAARVDEPEVVEARVPRGNRILLVEDDEMSRSTVARLLEKRGATVVPAENGREALDILAGEERFDLILMDVKMPVMDGSEATRRIRSDTSGRFDPDIPIIAVTAYAMAGDREKFLAQGMNGYVVKPVDAKVLFEAVERIMAGGGPEQVD